MNLTYKTYPKPLFSFSPTTTTTTKQQQHFSIAPVVETINDNDKVKSMLLLRL
jgi:hypothetical protein